MCNGEHLTRNKSWNRFSVSSISPVEWRMFLLLLPSCSGKYFLDTAVTLTLIKYNHTITFPVQSLRVRTERTTCYLELPLSQEPLLGITKDAHNGRVGFHSGTKVSVRRSCLQLRHIWNPIYQEVSVLHLIYSQADHIPSNHTHSFFLLFILLILIRLWHQLTEELTSFLSNPHNRRGDNFFQVSIHNNCTRTHTLLICWLVVSYMLLTPPHLTRPNCLTVLSALYWIYQDNRS